MRVNLSLIGALGNLIAQGVLEQVEMKFSFFEYAKIELPILIASICYFVFIGYKFLPNNENLSIMNSIYSTNIQPAPKWKQNLSLIILLLTLFL